MDAGLAEIASGFYRVTPIKSLDLSYSGLDDVKSTNVLNELILRNKTITSQSLLDVSRFYIEEVRQC